MAIIQGMQATREAIQRSIQREQDSGDTCIRPCMVDLGTGKHVDMQNLSAEEWMFFLIAENRNNRGNC